MGKYLKKESETFGLSIRQEISDLAEFVLNEEETIEIDKLSEMMISKKLRKMAIERLKEVVGYTPKRPVYYVWLYMNDFSNNTRVIVFFLGSYIDQLMKHVSHEKGANILRSLFSSLKNNIKWTRCLLGHELTDMLNMYERIIYTPAKHDFESKPRQSHLFSSKEAIAISFITMNLASRLTDLSEEARAYSLNKIY